MPRIANVDLRQPLNPAREMIVGVGPIDNPPASTPPIARSKAEAAMILGQVSILDTNEVELSLTRRNGGFVIVAVVHPIAPALRQRDRSQQAQRGARNHKRPPQSRHNLLVLQPLYYFIHHGADNLHALRAEFVHGVGVVMPRRIVDVD